MTTAERYRALLARIDEWFQKARAGHPGVIPCAKGCSACCCGPFDLSVADMLLVREAFFRLPRAVRRRVVHLARAQLEKARAIEPRVEGAPDIDAIGESAFDRICAALSREPCPLLDEEGRCRIYDDRPAACRLMGLPMRAAKGRVIRNACPIRRRFPEYAKLPPQRVPLASVEREEEELSIEAAAELFGAGGESRAHSRSFIALWLKQLEW